MELHPVQHVVPRITPVTGAVQFVTHISECLVQVVFGVARELAHTSYAS